MKKLLLIAVVLCMSGCATTVPIAPKDWTVPTPDDLDGANKRIQLSKLDSRYQAGAKEKYRQNKVVTMNLGQYSTELNEVRTKNQGLKDSYGMWNGIIGGLGSLSAPLVLAEPAAVVVPILAFGYTAFAVPTLQWNIDPAVVKGDARHDDVSKLITKTWDYNHLFDLMVLEPDKIKATRAYEEWATNIDNVTKSINGFFELPNQIYSTQATDSLSVRVTDIETGQ